MKPDDPVARDVPDRWAVSSEPWTSTVPISSGSSRCSAAVGALLFLAPVARVPYPILMVVGGLVLSFVPGTARVRAPPDLVLVAFLPPLLYAAAFFTSLRDLRANLRPITRSPSGSSAVTTAGVG